MKYQFQIITANDSSHFIEEFENRLRWLKQRGYSLYVETEPISEEIANYIFRLQGTNHDKLFRNEDIIYIFKHQMSEILAEHIINGWETKLLWKEILKNCRRVNREDRQIIYDKSSDFLKRCHNNESLNLLMNFGRKNRIAHRLLEHINSSPKLVVEGFINFCLQDYLTEIKFAVELAAEELKNEKEYNEFVNLLRYFVDTQVPKICVVNLLMDKSGVFFLWDEAGIKIEETYMSYYLDDMLLEEINLDDVLISILITIAPRKIILHNTDSITHNESVEMIKKVFKEKITECGGCERCCSYQEGNEKRHH
ncbi:MAG: putative sporulation protein YtxC [Syntrophomonadaceae bacterium]|nr:putative sporulation protein YtxC [Syntrophomonadaceae bacterium]MDD3888857.1 putative sporulation protein YtxC [Syntrophomonadaceae bacterium]MDD4548997.1 putative sporulation protein YtxC [Syntrophomonadaceae bacterium]